jgi:hypothetical protein
MGDRWFRQLVGARLANGVQSNFGIYLKFGPIHQVKGHQAQVISASDQFDVRGCRWKARFRHKARASQLSVAHELSGFLPRLELETARTIDGGGRRTIGEPSPMHLACVEVHP